ncbi:RNA polymerase subunit sigma-24 [Paenibacillus selenitireducens]|uniref:RNA polymerase subunit sigma-24 n=1 Tax=Paenibacillus selenitireducens TaxID=1324314 RepID=A0A1T2X9Q6_9BACL|nr:DUF1492 domain-containing protein [Paenibacillus selenitireducens]OPA76637.1 RNA polymerase subunit sigma-24 [Paenibacillus selenitireducens]
MDEHHVIEQLSQYRQKLARIRVLSTYDIGSGITVSRLNGDDQLQELHRKLRCVPSYMYLSKREQKLETTAHAYLQRYPSGVKSQLAEIPTQGTDGEDSKLLREIKQKIEKVIAARGWEMNDLDAVLERLAEFQDLQAEVKRIDTVIEALETYKPDYVRLLRFVYLEDKSVQEALDGLGVSKTTFYDLKRKAQAEYVLLAQ